MYFYIRSAADQEVHTVLGWLLQPRHCGGVEAFVLVKTSLQELLVGDYVTCLKRHTIKFSLVLFRCRVLIILLDSAGSTLPALAKHDTYARLDSKRHQSGPEAA